jgi:hypothetical protein
MIGMAPCYACGRTFAFNVELVPSFPAPEHGGDRMPICESCIRIVNHRRRQNGLEEWPVPPGAYEPEEV